MRALEQVLPALHEARILGVVKAAEEAECAGDPLRPLARLQSLLTFLAVVQVQWVEAMLQIVFHALDLLALRLNVLIRYLIVVSHLLVLDEGLE